MHFSPSQALGQAVAVGRRQPPRQQKLGNGLRLPTRHLQDWRTMRQADTCRCCYWVFVLAIDYDDTTASN